ncbi:MAG: DUF4252 domain-containing protein [Muribaculaceae bacterium]|nr:DUF4252 domain-containing protein [Muribaculaceae bacterium]
MMALIALIGTQSCIAQSKVFKEAASVEGVTSVYISPMLLKLGGGSKDLGHGLDDAVKELKSFEVITTEEECKDIKKVADICRKKIAQMGCEILMEVNEDNDKVKIYASVPEGSEYADQLIIEVDEPKEYTVIYVKGKIDLAKVVKDKG